MLDWTWTAKTMKGGPVRICFAMNISILANGGKGKEINMTPLAEYTSQMFANRDIIKGEELMCEFIVMPHIYLMLVLHAHISRAHISCSYLVLNILCTMLTHTLSDRI